MEFLYLLEKIRTPILNEFMLLITRFGEETVFLITALILFWCVDKHKGYYILAVGFFGTLTNQFLKLWFRIPRPWVIDGKFTILEQARETATGYSFPSGHTQSAVGMFGAIAYTTKNKMIRIVAILIAALVSFSRMYIGVHTPLDVFASIALAIFLIVLLRPMIAENHGKMLPIIFAFMITFALGFLCFVEFFKFPPNIDVHNLHSGVNNAYTLIGALLGLTVVYIVDEKWVKFSTSAVWWTQIIKVCGGLLIILAVKSGLKTPLNLFLGESIGRITRYFLIVIVAGILWPLTFKFFQKSSTKEN